MSGPFSLGYEATAAVPFTLGGVKYARGERFPYLDLGIIEFDLRGLWAAERIEFTGSTYVAKQTAPQTPAAKPTPPQQPQQHHRR